MWNRREWGRCVVSGLLGCALPVARAQAMAQPLQAPLPGAASAAMPGAAGTPGRANPSRVQLAVEHRAALEYLPLTIADRLGYFESEGLDVQVREMAEPGQAMQALVSGSVQAFSGPYSTALKLRARGQSFPSIVVQGRAPQLVFGVSSKTLAGFRDVRDLRGRKVAVSGLGSSGHAMMLALFKSAQLGADAVQFVAQSSPTAVLASFRNGLVDAICYTDPVITQLEQDGALRVVADTRTVRGSAEVFGGPMPAGCLCVSADYLASHAAQCQALVSAMVRALKWLQTAGPSDINKTVPETYFHGDRALYLSAFSRCREAWSPDGLMPETGPITMARVLARLDESSTSRQVDLAQTYTNALALRAKARFRA